MCEKVSLSLLDVVRWLNLLTVQLRGNDNLTFKPKCHLFIPFDFDILEAT